MQLTLTKTTIAHQTYWLGSTERGLAFVGSANGPQDEWSRFYPAASAVVDTHANQTARQALTAYLTGARQAFDLPLDQTNGTTLQRQVWHALQTIPYGHTTTYSQLATAINRPTATRAVATAVGKNPLLIVVPCHRVLRKDGTLGGYRGGLAMKTALLALENHFH
ncbi:methylated-DNA--[protein]-cysteine S-methyltransferase [Lactiplantibacillus garii]|uniref:methylated-DNA--[protein]-cysteine S-methyltransferase n=1 Tax=Lactiplantibacillus garii TaxID=2306423 RepID=A0A426D9X2_9LACO|nr:methylated-DNA--[protein]-cysteine S-methyltransferase [Lactiplantibacillus garii]RRK11353.1 methylated-DNA--[protein]-cysteine S-methyltransferase [Lactiplantibacillus garii]